MTSPSQSLKDKLTTGDRELFKLRTENLLT
jgi:hypothetical protein